MKAKRVKNVGSYGRPLSATSKRNLQMLMNSVRCGDCECIQYRVEASATVHGVDYHCPDCGTEIEGVDHLVV